MDVARHGLMVVGVDGSEASTGVLEWAVAEAGLRRSRLRVVLILEEPSYAPYAPVSARIDAGGLERQARERLHTTLRKGIGPGFADQVEYAVHVGRPAQVLIAESKAADLLVLGSRSHEGLFGGLLGSVSQQCSVNAHCPVVVIRQDLLQDEFGLLDTDRPLVAHR